MTKADIIQKLMDAQDLLSDVYHYAILNDLVELQSEMSCADQCIIDGIEVLDETEKV